MAPASAMLRWISALPDARQSSAPAASALVAGGFSLASRLTSVAIPPSEMIAFLFLVDLRPMSDRTAAERACRGACAHAGPMCTCKGPCAHAGAHVGEDGGGACA